MEGISPTYGRRPLAFRAQSVDESLTQLDLEDEVSDGHVRRKSQYTAASGQPLITRRASRRLSNKSRSARPSSGSMTGLQAVQEGRSSLDSLDALTPPITPIKSKDSMASDTGEGRLEIKTYDFTRIDYEMDRAKVIGKGLWSTVHWAQPISRSPGLVKSPLTPPPTPERPTGPPCSLFAVKLPARPDSNEVFTHEAKMLTHLQQSRCSHHYLVPFHGLDTRYSSLVFEGVLGGSLEHLVARLKVMTELARHLELRGLFPKLAMDLVSGLNFIHASRVVHADVKPANILLDISEEPAGSRPTLRARYIDFSASFIQGADHLPNSVGTWDYMAPEQMRSQKDWNTPTFASDVWSVGVMLLYILAGGSPYAAACAPNNLFMLREAIKTGDPLGFARMDPVVRKRMAACQDFVDCCRLAMQKDRDKRISAALWEGWVEAELVAG